MRNRSEKIVEIATWVVIIIVIFGVRFLPVKLLDNDSIYILIGGITSFALLYYLVIYKIFSRSKRVYFKIIADVVLIGVLIHLLKDYGQYFFALYFLPIAAAALELEFISALLIATIASLFVVFEIFLSSQDLLPGSNQFFSGAWQIAIILFITIFCRMLAIQIRQERTAKEESILKQKSLEQEAERQKEFLSLTSHQLYTPLSIIRGFVSMLNEGTLGKLSPKQKDAVCEIHTNSIRMVDLVDELLSISRIQAGTFALDKKFSHLNDVVEGSVDSLCKSKQNNNKQKNNVKIKIEKGDLPPINLDGDKIRQVILNLLDNAIKYTKTNVIIRTSATKDGQVVEIIDQGVGIDQADFEKLFQPFFRGKNILELDNKGTGLGLYISRIIIEKHGGQIWAKNNLPVGKAGPDGQGATFSFRLPK